MSGHLGCPGDTHLSALPRTGFIVTLYLVLETGYQSDMAWLLNKGLMVITFDL